MFFHHTILFVAILITITRFKVYTWKDALTAMIPHLVFSTLVIPLDYAFGWDYMQYYEAGGVPLIEDVSTMFAENGYRFLTCVLVLVLYFAFSFIFTAIYIGQHKLVEKHRKPIESQL